MKTPVQVGIIGCGTISGAYFKGCAPYSMIKIKACADLDMDRAKARAEEYGVQACSVDALLADPDIQMQRSIWRQLPQENMCIVKSHWLSIAPMGKRPLLRLDKKACGWAVRPIRFWAAVFRPAAS
jgi:hypothetical protein